MTVDEFTLAVASKTPCLRARRVAHTGTSVPVTAAAVSLTRLSPQCTYPTIDKLGETVAPASIDNYTIERRTDKIRHLILRGAPRGALWRQGKGRKVTDIAVITV